MPPAPPEGEAASAAGSVCALMSIARDLSGNCMGPPDKHWVPALRNLEKLWRLDLSNNLLSSRGIEALAPALRAMTALQ
ncbi:hypothetical protein T484DRAFT_1913726, partial [Baffinella frigidus]